MKNKLFTLTLTPALSPGERENRFQRLGKAMTDFCSTSILVIENKQRLFPLPEGEGQGEGKRDIHSSSLFSRVGASAAIGAAFLFFAPNVFAQTNAVATDKSSLETHRYKIALCDWMILKRQKLGAFQLTKDIGADGVEVDMGSLGTNETFISPLTMDAALRKQFLDKARELNLEIPSLAMSGFYAQSFAGRGTVPRMTQDCIDTMKAMNVKIAFLPLGVRSDLVKHPEFRSNVVERLKMIGAQAEKAGVIIGVETELPAAEQIKLLDDVGSPAIKIYYNFSNPLQNGHDLIAELRLLGKDRICQIHCTDQDGVWLQDDPKIDMPKVKQTLDEMGWSGWLVVERSRDAKDSRNVKKNFGANTAYLKSIFQKP